MKEILQRARFRPGPLLAIALVWFALSATVLRAHDPGLSALDVTVNDGGIVVTLSLAAADLAAIAPDREAATGRHLSGLARDAIRVLVDGETLRATDDVTSVDDGGARVTLSFARPHSSGRAARLTITSDVPKRMARGHRELLVVNVAGRVATETLLDTKSDSATVDLRAASPPLRLAWSFLAVGVGHILSGYDHLVFVAGLVLAARRVRELVVALTAFTVAHSVSLMLVVFGGVHAPASIVEPLIAASVAWIGVENLLSGLDPRGCAPRTPLHALSLAASPARFRLRQRLRRDLAEAPSARRRADCVARSRCSLAEPRWLLVFGFGLIHGFGFAGALIELGFGSSPGEVALALLSFNAGVEAGQLATAAALLPVVWMLRTRPRLEATLLPACSVLVAIAGGWWLFERLG